MSLITAFDSFRLDVVNSFSKPRHSETGSENSRVLISLNNETMIGHFPEGLEILFVQQAHPARKYSNYFFQRRTDFWKKLVEHGKHFLK